MPGSLPSSVLVVDAAILVRAVLGSGGELATLVEVERSRTLVISQGIFDEAFSVITTRLPAWRGAYQISAEVLGVYPDDLGESDLAAAAECLRLAPQSGNGSVRDAHVLALAWKFDADIWTHDRDFAGTGWPTWSSRNLRRALELPDRVR